MVTQQTQESETLLLANPSLPPGKVVVQGHGQSCSASWYAGMNRGTVDLDTLGGPEDWWVARAIVQGSPEVRGKGIGSTLLNLALEKAVSMGATKVHVVPGGYGANPEDQQRFYEKNGFKKKRVRSAGFKTASYVWTWTKG